MAEVTVQTVNTAETTAFFHVHGSSVYVKGQLLKLPIHLCLNSGGSLAVYIPFTLGSRCWTQREVSGLYLGELRVLGNPSNVSVCPPGEAARGSDAARPAPAQNPPAHPGTVAVTTASGFVPSASPWGCQGTPAGFLHLWRLHSPIHCHCPSTKRHCCVEGKKKAALLHPSLTLLCIALRSHSHTPASVLVESLHLPCSF